MQSSKGDDDVTDGSFINSSAVDVLDETEGVDSGTKSIHAVDDGLVNNDSVIIVNSFADDEDLDVIVLVVRVTDAIVITA
ncbi:hypothetical protein NDU88_008840 [Pleurodeles waltl]|uniref:Uncharacterized protein n=1 Tax=Pleurodeles waltl TaxID=8319 RepID=A0AAV7PVI6_PLEWA|nr:hypothetical protein NDU88_008840 [Pleurodeles waltl]